MEYLHSFDPTLAVDLADELPSDGVEQPFVSRVKGMPNEHFLSCLFMTYEHLTLALVRAAKVHDFINANLAGLMAAVAVAAVGGGASDSEFNVDVNQTPAGVAVAAAIDGTADAVEGVDVAAAVAAALSNTSVSSSTTATPSTPQEAILALSRQCLSAAIDLAQRSIAQLLTLRKDSTCKLPVDRMKFLWETSLHFVAQIEKISGSSAYTIRQALLAQTSSFLAYLHDQSKLTLTSTLDNEKWTQCDVSAERQGTIDRLAAGRAFLTGGGTTSCASSSGNLHVAGVGDSIDADLLLAGAGGGWALVLEQVLPKRHASSDRQS